jgi:hypothetical protein
MPDLHFLGVHFPLRPRIDRTVELGQGGVVATSNSSSLK